MIVRGYTLDLYCSLETEEHGYREFPHQYVGESWAETSKKARIDGWILHKSIGECVCPKCARAGKKLP